MDLDRLQTQLTHLSPESPMRRAPGDIKPALTKRELEIVNAAPTLLSISNISADLGISLSTTKNHLYSIYGKIGVSSITQLIVASSYHEIIDEIPGRELSPVGQDANIRDSESEVVQLLSLGLNIPQIACARSVVAKTVSNQLLGVRNATQTNSSQEIVVWGIQTGEVVQMNDLEIDTTKLDVCLR